MKKIIYIIIIIAVLLIIIGGIFVYKYSITKEINKMQLQNQSIAQVNIVKSSLSGDWEQNLPEATPNEDDPSCSPDYLQIEFNADSSYSSWLHCRPSESGTWDLKGNILTITVPDSPPEIYKITIKGDILTLGDQGDFKRIVTDDIIK